MSQCQHIMDTGRPCGTPPLKGQPFCYYHRRLHADFILPGHPEYVPPALESRASIQIALNHIYLALSKNLLDRRQANTMLSTLRLAQKNVVEINLPSNAATEISPAMQKALHLDDQLEDQSVRQASQDAPRSTDTAPRSAPLQFGINPPDPLLLRPDPQRAVERSNMLAAKKFSRFEVPEFVPELDLHEWLRVTRDLPPKGEAGTEVQQLNCRRVLQVLNYDAIRRRMAGAPAAQ
jgi:hypothetical protein